MKYRKCEICGFKSERKDGTKRCFMARYPLDEIRIMPADTENGVDNQPLIVQSVGNAWVICNSVSRPGHKYYFNTFTGESVWNLSPEEIEKAKKRTKVLSKGEIKRCPEPPLDAPAGPEQNTPVYNMQNINNQLSNQYPNMFPVNLLNGVHGVPNVSGLNTNIWSSTPNSMSFVPRIYCFQPPINYDILKSQEYYQTLSLQDQMHGQERLIQNSHNKQNVFKDSEYVASNRSRPHKRWSSNNFDLRQKLRNRSKSQSCEPNTREEISYRHTDVENGYRVSKMNISHTDEAPSKYDLSALKQLKSPDSNAINWFIVVDMEIILHNFPFLNKITDPDQNCYLMVPDHVVLDLQNLACRGNDVSARRIYRFLSEQIDSELAFKGEDMTEVADNDIEKTFITCVELAKINNVILLSNEIEYYKFKLNSYNVRILTIKELQMILMNGEVKPVHRFNASPTMAIKIVVPNERNLAANEPVMSRRFRSKTPDYEAPPYTYTLKKKEVTIQPDTIPILSRRTVSTGVQPGNSYLDDHSSISSRPHILAEFDSQPYFCNNRETKDIETVHSISSQNERQPTRPVQKKRINIQSDDSRVHEKAKENNLRDFIRLDARASQNNLDVHSTANSITPESIEFERGSEDSYFSSNLKNKRVKRFYGASSQNAPVLNCPNNKQVDEFHLETAPVSKPQVVPRAQHPRASEYSLHDYERISVDVRDSQNNLDVATTNSSKTPQSVECDRNSEDSYFSSNQKNKRIKTFNVASSQKASTLTKPIQEQGVNTCSESVSLSKRMVDSSVAPQNVNRKETSQNKLDTHPKTPQPVQKEFNTSLEEYHFCKNPTTLEFHRSVSHQHPNNEGNTPKTKYRWRRQRRNTSSQMNITQLSSATTNDSTVCDRDKSHEDINKSINLAESCENPETDLRQVAPENASRDHSLDRSSLSSQAKTTGRPSVVIEESSTSGVISNTTNDSETMNSVSHTKMKRIIKVRHAEKFEVAGQIMEDVLRTRQEEWVLRFVQIMEEVLREKLRDSSPFHNKDYAAPWATDLPELTRCIIKKYSDYFNVVDAANRLSFTLYRISDEKGNMSTNIEPDQYMEMYSFGVYLIETLKDITENCEDLKAADESLKQLLYDIQNANMDVSHNDTFVDELQESAIDITEPIGGTVDILPQNTDKDNEMETREDDHTDNKNTYRLRSRKKNTTQIYSKPQKKQLKDLVKEVVKNRTSAENTFFSSLQLQKTNTDNTYVKTHDLQGSPKSTKVIKTPPTDLPLPKSAEVIETLPDYASPSPKSITLQSPSKVPESPKNTQSSPINLQSSPKKQFEIQATFAQELLSNDSKSNSNKTKVNENTSTATVQPVIVRNFSSIAQFEEKLIQYNKQYNCVDDIEDYNDGTYDESEYPLDYYDEVGDYDDSANYYDETEEYHADGEYNVYKHQQHNAGESEKSNFGEITEIKNGEDKQIGDAVKDVLEDGEIRDDDEIKTAPNVVQKYHDPQNEKNERFRRLVKQFVEEICETFKAVRQLCTEFVEDFRKSQDTSPEMKMKLRRARANILKISNSLNRILDRETRTPENNMILQLKKAKLSEFVPDEDLRLGYTTIITKCRDQAYAIYKFLIHIMKSAGINQADTALA